MEMVVNRRRDEWALDTNMLRRRDCGDNCKFTLNKMHRNMRHAKR